MAAKNAAATLHFTELLLALLIRFRKIHFAVHYIMEMPKIFDSAVGFEVADESVISYFFIKDFKFYDMNNSIIVDFSQGYDNIFGFDFFSRHRYQR